MGHTADVLEMDDKSTVRANVGPCSENWQLASACASVGTTRQPASVDHDHNMGGGEGA